MLTLFCRYTVIPSLLVLLAAQSNLRAAENIAASPARRRAALIQRAAGGAKAIPTLRVALSDENLVVRRTACRLLSGIGVPAREALGEALGNSDLVVRRTALWKLFDLLGTDALPHLAKALRDPEVSVRHATINLLVSLEPRTDEIKGLLSVARKDQADVVRSIAARALWPFHREAVSIRDRKDYDRDVKVVQTHPLPKDEWRFKLDPGRDGHQKKWYEPGFDDSKWAPISIEQAWQKAGYKYIGVAWYRRSIHLPPKPRHTAVDIHFKGVDECAWVWLNGKYVGQHDIGPEGWNQPFLLDVTKEVKWGQKNQLTVRAMNTAFAGGIWQPVQIEVLQ